MQNFKLIFIVVGYLTFGIHTMDFNIADSDDFYINQQIRDVYSLLAHIVFLLIILGRDIDNNLANEMAS